MLSDIPLKKVVGLAVAMVPRQESEEDHAYFWDCYLLNLMENPITSVLVNSKGYGIVAGEERQTSVMRYFFDTLNPNDAVKIEPVPVELLDLASEYWISFSQNDYLYDKRYIFVQGSLSNANLIDLPLLQRKGVIIR